MTSQVPHSRTAQVESSIYATRSSGPEPAVYLHNAQYDPRRDMLPFYVVSSPSQGNIVKSASLVVKKVKPVEPAAAQLIRARYGRFLGPQFPVEPGGETSRGVHTNCHRIVPFRIAASGEVEELIDYDVRWRENPAPATAARRSSASFKNNSVLATGTWYKIGITRTGLHRVNRAFLNSLGITSATLSSSSIRVFGNGGAMLPERNDAPRVDDLAENPILVVDGGDGSFDHPDYFLFYATGPTGWKTGETSTQLKFSATKNLYSDTSFYFISVDYNEGVPQRIQTSPSAPTSNTSTSTYDYYNYHEEDLYNLAKSGRRWYGESFDFLNEHVFRWPDGSFVTQDSIIVECTLAGNHPNITPRFEIKGNGVVMTLTTYAVGSSQYANYAERAGGIVRGLNTNANEIAITVRKVTPQVTGWVDKVTVNARRRLTAGVRQLLFRDARVSGPGRVAQYNITTSAPQGLQLWNVTDPLKPFIQAYNIVSGGIQFRAPSPTISEYCLAPPGDYYTPTVAGRVANQNLHAIQQADYLIVCHPMFVAEADRLGAFHQKQEGYTYAVATVDQIYNEFSSGRQDATAIRDFIRMIYERNLGSRELQYVCLMGDGSYNNRSRNLVNNSNLIPTYQSVNSLSQLYSVPTDDFYGMMDPHEGENATDAGLIDISIGRFTCRTLEEVREVLDKIEHYYSQPGGITVEEAIPVSSEASQSTHGDWRTWLMFLADDSDDAGHMEQSDSLARMAARLAPGYNIDKIMLDAYQRFSTPGGNRYPDASEDFTRRLRKGVLLFNYTGHGGEVGLTAERLVDVEMINKFDNINQLALFITATCEFTRYDDPNRTSAGELSLLNPKGAAVSLFTTSRLAFSHTNFELNQRLITSIFSYLPDGRRPALGDIMRFTKRDVGHQNYSYAHFHLIGDPALRLAYPDYQVRTTRFNGRNLVQPVQDDDTLKALARITVEGEVVDNSGKKLSFNGIVYPTVFDKEQQMTGLVNDPSSMVPPPTGCDTCDAKPFTFNLQKNILYRGKARVTNGNFSFTFLVPKDISFAPGRGKITYYATNGKLDAMGHYSHVIVGGEASDAITDNAGPEIKLFINDENFVNGGTTDENPVLYADLIDSSGINTSGIGLGHDMTVILDEKGDKPLVLNDYYEANLNTYQAGRVRYPFDALEEGPHTLTFKAWDIQNNSSVMALDFVVANRADVALKHVLNYPNPFTTRTKFFFEHNQSGVPLRVHIQVYNVSGKLVKTIQRTVVSDSFMSDGIEWDGKDDFGDKLARGVYIYRLAILDINNKKAEKIEKLVILN